MKNIGLLIVGALLGGILTFLITRSPGEGMPISGDPICHEFGIRMTKEEGVSFYGFEELDALIRAGAKISSIEPGGAIMQKTGESEEAVTMYFGGGAFNATLDR